MPVRGIDRAPYMRLIRPYAVPATELPFLQPMLAPLAAERGESAKGDIEQYAVARCRVAKLDGEAAEVKDKECTSAGRSPAVCLSTEGCFRPNESNPSLRVDPKCGMSKPSGVPRAAAVAGIRHASLTWRGRLEDPRSRRMASIRRRMMQLHNAGLHPGTLPPAPAPAP